MTKSSTLALLKQESFTMLTDGWNDWLLQWIAYSNWIYSRDFELPEVKGRSVYLRIDGLDTVASIKFLYTLPHTHVHECACRHTHAHAHAHTHTHVRTHTHMHTHTPR